MTFERIFKSYNNTTFYLHWIDNANKNDSKDLLVYFSLLPSPFIIKEKRKKRRMINSEQKPILYVHIHTHVNKILYI